jgi:DNA polymerase alpha-associated DNA helicase A
MISTDFLNSLQVCWIPIFKAKKLILAGDPKQLPPTIHSLPTSKDSGSQRRTGSRVGAYIEISITPSDTSQPDGLDAISNSHNKLDSAEPGNTPASDPHPSSRMVPNMHGLLTPPQTLEMTMFERLDKMYGPDIKCMLTVQYRCVTGLR